MNLDRAILVRDKRLEDFICEELLGRKNRKTITALIRDEAREIPLVFQNYFDEIGGWKYGGMIFFGYEKHFVFTEEGICAILESKNMDELKLKKGSPRENYREISDLELFTMQEALRRLFQEVSNEK